MKPELDFREIEKAILDVLSEDFSGVEIVEVHVMDDVDVEDDDILRVKVVFKGKARDLMPKFLNRAIRKVRPALSARHVSAFPMMSFISADDAKVSVSA